MSGIAIVGQNCWRRAHAHRVAFLVDTAAYFRAFRAAALLARETITIIGWDLHSGTPLAFYDEAATDTPNELGPFLDYLVKARPSLRVRVLDWDSPLLFGLDRQFMPQAYFDWFTHPNVSFALDHQHPFGASQHQKLIVIDDCIAFVGGADLTLGRLDDCCHQPEDNRRRYADGTCPEPYHDVQVAVSGEIAAALGEVARARWMLATGEHFPAREPLRNCWPADLSVDLTDVDVAIARTLPRWKFRREVREVEALFTDCIAAARRTLYIEAQYITARVIGRALADRLRQPDGPEVVIVLPRAPTGWLEQNTMGAKQRLLLAHLRDADKHDRLRVYTPVVGSDGSIGVSVHSKVMIVDDVLVRIGSANLNNRSMGLDSECDLAIEVTSGSREASTITDFRHRLLAEHLGVDESELAQAVERRGSLTAAIEELRKPGCRSLVPMEIQPPSLFDTAVDEFEIVDPVRPLEPERMADDLARDPPARDSVRNAAIHLAVLMSAMLLLAGLWHWQPVAEMTDLGRMEAFVDSLNGGWVGPVVIICAFVIGGMLMFPVTVLIAVTGLLYDPLSGLGIALSGSVLSALTGYGAGSLVGSRSLRRLAGSRLDRVNAKLAHRGVLTVTIIRLLPLLPFTLINMAAGAAHVRLRDYLAGTVLGMAPGVILMTLFAGQISAIVRMPQLANILFLIGVLLIMGPASLWAWRRFGRRHTGFPGG